MWGHLGGEVTDWALPLDDPVRDSRRRRLLVTGPPVAYWLGESDLDPRSMFELPRGTTAITYDARSDHVYFNQSGTIVARSAASLAPPPPLVRLPEVTLLRRPWLRAVLPAGDSRQMALGVARLPLDLGLGCGVKSDRWGTVSRLPGDVRWRLVDAALPCALSSRRIHASPTFAFDGFALVSAVYHGLYRTVDGGLSWQPAMAGLRDQEVRDAVFAPSRGRPSTVFLTTEAGFAWRSRDAGTSWQSVGRFVGLAVSPRYVEDHRVYAVASHTNDVYLSTDDGTHWRRVGRIPVTELETEATYLAVLDAAAGRMPVILALVMSGRWWKAQWATGAMRPYQSDDGGRTWVTTVPASRWPNGVADTIVGPLSSPRGPVWLLDGRDTANKVHAFGILRSDDLGATWRRVGLPARLEFVSIAAAPDGRLVAAETEGMPSTVALTSLVDVALPLPTP